MSGTTREMYVSVDVETAGPNPHSYALLSIGACLLDTPEVAFYIELQPIQDAAMPEALAITGLSMQRLKEEGTEPKEAMARFKAWLEQVIPSDSRPVFLAFNAPFDWMFVNDYFQRYLKRNPFGHSALDMKAFFMGLTGCSWSGTKMADVAAHYGKQLELQHHALRDAEDQAMLFREMLQDARTRRLQEESSQGE